MTVRRLVPRLVERVWGVETLPPDFEAPAPGVGPIGEVWHEDAGEAHPLLVKHLFTSQRLSIQVHPDDTMARAAGYARGKDEAWYVVAAEPGAVIGLGLTRAVDAATFRAAALSGAIEALIDWRPVKAGETYFAPAGTVHAIGPGLTIVEIQQNCDVTYRLYDYGRPRALHLEEGVAASDLAPWCDRAQAATLGDDREMLVDSAKFTIEKWVPKGARTADFGVADVLLIPLGPGLAIDGAPARSGEVWRASGRVTLAGEAGLLVTAPAPHAPFAIL